jgi:hypothetical protein
MVWVLDVMSSTQDLLGLFDGVLHLAGDEERCQRRVLIVVLGIAVMHPELVVVCRSGYEGLDRAVASCQQNIRHAEGRYFACSQLEGLSDIINELHTLYPITVFSCGVTAILPEHQSHVLLEDVLIGDVNGAGVWPFWGAGIDRRRRRVDRRYGSA